MILSAVATVLLCLPMQGPYVIREAGTYDFRCGGSVTASVGSGIKVEADGVTLLAPVVRDSWECIEVQGRSRITIRGGLLERCTKMGVRLFGDGEDNTIEGLTVRDSGNGILAYTRGAEAQVRLRIVGNQFHRMTGPLDGHAIGIQSAAGALISRNVVVDTVGDGIAVYFNNGVAEQTDVLVLDNAVVTGQPGITFRATGGTSRARHGNRAAGNTVLSPQPFYVTGNLTPAPGLWSVEIADNHAPGDSTVRSTTTACPRVFVRDAGAWTWPPACQ